MTPPDWERYAVHGAGGGSPVGDPTRWGAQLATALSDAGGPIVINTPQILAVSTRDNYSRSWSCFGTLTLPPATWVANDSTVELLITTGVGQIQITQSILLKDPGDPSAVPPAPYPASGLCLTQHKSFGGPYNSVLTPGAPFGATESRSFAITGGLVGQSFGIRARYTSSGFPPTAGWPTTAVLSMIVTPFAAGEGL